MIQYSIPYGYNSFANIQKISVLNIISEKLSVTDFKCFLHFNLNDLINGTTALHESAKNNNTKLTEYIICQLNENNINSLDDKGFTPFDYALDLGHFEILKILLKNKSKHDLTKHVFCNLKNIEKSFRVFLANGIDLEAQAAQGYAEFLNMSLEWDSMDLDSPEQPESPANRVNCVKQIKYDFLKEIWLHNQALSALIPELKNTIKMFFIQSWAS